MCVDVCVISNTTGVILFWNWNYTLYFIHFTHALIGLPEHWLAVMKPIAFHQIMIIFLSCWVLFLPFFSYLIGCTGNWTCLCQFHVLTMELNLGPLCREVTALTTAPIVVISFMLRFEFCHGFWVLSCFLFYFDKSVSLSCVASFLSML